MGGELIGDEELLNEADEEENEASADTLIKTPAQRIVGELRNDLVVPHDRPCDQVRKEHDEEAEHADAVAWRGAPQAVDEIGDQLERVEADADRQDQRGLGEFAASHLLQDARAEIEIFEQAEHREIGDDGELKRPAPILSDRKLRQSATSPRSVRSGAARSERPTSHRRTVRPRSATIRARMGGWPARNRCRPRLAGTGGRIPGCERASAYAQSHPRLLTRSWSRPGVKPLFGG